MPQVSIIIRTKNEARHLGDLLEMLKKQTFQDSEIIVVDSGSTDGTLEIAKKFGTKIIKINPDDFTFPFASNIGAENANGEYLVYISGHCLPLSEKWIEDGVKILEGGKKDFVSAAVSEGTAASLRSASQSSMRDCDGEELKKYKNKIMGVYCQLVYPLADASRFEKILLFLGRPFYKKRKIIKKPCMGCMGATNCMLRRDLWESRRFNPAFANGGEDGEWAYYWLEQGYAAVRDFKFTVRHTHGLGPWDYFKQYLHWLSCYKPKEFKYRKHKFN